MAKTKRRMPPARRPVAVDSPLGSGPTHRVDAPLRQQPTPTGKPPTGKRPPRRILGNWTPKPRRKRSGLCPYHQNQIAILHRVPILRRLKKPMIMRQQKIHHRRHLPSTDQPRRRPIPRLSRKWSLPPTLSSSKHAIPRGGRYRKTQRRPRHLATRHRQTNPCGSRRHWRICGPSRTRGQATMKMPPRRPPVLIRTTPQALPSRTQPRLFWPV
mmetsp:Transcript_23123/g.66768  ORF Transcript_23123/g.66768 Transcript_23123/m.66768 type:complete len:213 (+) Transcript_23123:1014-1652(+)